MPGESRYRILMADDIVRYHALYETAITDATGATVHFATNGEEALEKLASPIPYDLLILDLNMPKLGGEETLRRLRQDPNYDTLPVLILTGDTDQETHRRLLDLGADDFVEKGTPPEIFVARLRAQLRHREALDRLTRLAVDMDIFAAGVLHDIRNLETNIFTICELAKAYLEDDPIGRQALMLEDLTALEDKADHLGRYATEIIRMVRETSKPLDPKPTAVAPLFEWAVKMAAPPGGTAKLTFEIRGSLEPVIADRHFLQLAILNLVQNAVKYARPGIDPHLVVGQRPGERAVSGPGGRTIVTTIEDNGIGVKRQELRRIFEPFVRGLASSKRDGGFGLGLTLVAKVMGTMNGRVWAELTPHGYGTIMCLELPKVDADKRGMT